MYKESVSDFSGYFTRAHKANTASPYVVLSQYGPYVRPDHKKTSGEDTPGYSKKRREGALLPFTNFLQVENKGVARSYDIEVQRNSDGFRSRHYGPVINQSGLGTLAFSNTVYGDKTSEDVVMQSAGARQVSSSWDVLTFAAEISQSVSMFRALGFKINKLLNDKPPGTPWDLWLEARYGWRTLLFDIQDINSAFSKSARPKTTKTTAGQSVSWTESSTTAYFNFDNIGQERLVTNQTFSMNSRGSVVTKGSPPRFQVNPLKTVWEVTRLSFVLDWFINVGRAIDAIQFATTVSGSTAGFGSRIESSYHAYRDFIPNAGYTTLKYVTEVDTDAWLERRRPSSVPLIPLISVNLDRFKVLDLVSLLVQAARR